MAEVMTHEDVERMLANHERWLERHAQEIALLTKVQLEQHQMQREQRELQQTMASIISMLADKIGTRQ